MREWDLDMELELEGARLESIMNERTKSRRRGWRSCGLGMAFAWWVVCVASVVVGAPRAAANWVAFQEADGVAYFAFASPARVERYDLAGGSWLPPVPLEAGPQAMLVDGGHLYLATGRSVRRMRTDGSEPVDVGSASADVRTLLAWGDYLYLVFPAYPYGNVRSIRKRDLVPAGDVQLTYDAYIGASLSPLYGRIYGHDEGLSPDDIQMLTLNADGTFGPSVDSPYHGTFPTATHTYMSPSGDRVIDDSGIVFEAADLRFAGNLGGAVEAIAFNGATNMIVLRGGRLYSHDAQLLPLGSAAVTSPLPRSLAVRGEDVLIFGVEAGGRQVSVERVPLSVLRPEEPGPALDPKGLAYVPDELVLDRDGVVLLFSKANSTFFRWSSRDREHLPSIPLTGSPAFAAYSPVTHRIYVANLAGRVDEIRLEEGLRQRPFALQPAQPQGLATAGGLVFVCDAAAPWSTHYLYSPDGGRQGSRDWSHYSKAWTWNEATRRMYHFRDSSSPNDLLFVEIPAQGGFGSPGETPYHGEVDTRPPIRVKPDGSLVVLGSGQMFEGSTLKRLPANLGAAITDAVWVGEPMVTLRASGEDSVIEKLHPTNYTVTRSRTLGGVPSGLLTDGSVVIAVTLHAGVPRFHLIDRDLGVQYASPVAPQSPGGLVAAGVGHDSVTLEWVDRSDNEDGFLVEYTQGSGGTWIAAPMTRPDQTRFTLAGLSVATAYEFRVRASNSVAVSTAAGPLSVRTLPDPRSPLGPPFQLAAVRVLGTSVELAWRDNATNELGFRLERRVGALGAWTNVLVSGPGVTGYVDRGVTAGRVYDYRVRAFNDFSDSEVSGELRVTTLAADNLPPSGEPRSVGVAGLSALRVGLAWVDGSSNEDGFIVLRRELPEGTFEEIGRTGAGIGEFADETVRPSRSYAYRVEAFNAFGKTLDPFQSVVANTPALGGRYQGLSARHRDIAYFVFSLPDRIERWDLADGRWLEPLSLPSPAGAILVLDEGIYLGLGRQVVRYDLGLRNPVPLGNRERDVNLLFAWRDYLYAGDSGPVRLLVVRRSTGQLVTEADGGFYAWHRSVAVSESRGMAYVRTAQVSPSDMLSVVLRDDGSMGPGKDSPYHGSYPDATDAWLSPDQTKVFDSAGIVYSAADLTYQGSLAGAVQDLVFLDGGRLAAVRGSRLVVFTSFLLSDGEVELPAAPVRLMAASTNLVAFLTSGEDPHGLVPRVVPISSLVPKPPAAPPALGGLEFRPDSLFLDRDGVLLLFSAEQKALFRWSVAGRMPLEGRGLLARPVYAAYSAPRHRAYFAYETGQITQLDLGSEGYETGFANLPARARGLATLGDLVFTCDASGAWATHSVFAPDGRRLGTREWNYYSREYTWNPAIRRIFHFRDDTSPNDLHSEEVMADGSFGEVKDTPYHGEIGIRLPIRVRPDGGLVVLGTGDVFDGRTLSRIATLGNEVDDVVWRERAIYTVREVGGLAQVQRWGPDYRMEASAQMSGTPLRLFALETGFLLVTLEEGQPRMTLLSDSLDTVHRSPVNHAPTGIEVSATGLDENAPVGTVVGRLAALDADPGDTHRFEIVAGGGGPLRVEGDVVQVAVPLDHERDPSVGVLIRVVDSGGRSFEQTLRWEVRNVNEAPTDLRLSPDTVPDNAVSGTRVGDLAVVDPDVGDRVFRVELLDDAGGRFRLSADGKEVQVAGPLSFAQGASHGIRVRATDAGGLSVEKVLTVKVTEYVAPPPLGELTLEFETPQSVVTSRWLESGFAVDSPVPYRVMPGAPDQPAPHAGSGMIFRDRAGTGLEWVHRTGQEFRVFSMRLGENGPVPAPGGTNWVEIIGYRRLGSPLVRRVILDGVADGPGGADDFQTVVFDDNWRGLVAFGLAAGAPCAVDSLAVHVGAAPSRPIVRMVTRDGVAFEPGNGIPEAPPFPHTASVGITRVGVASALTVQLSVAGTAAHAVDYFIEGWSESRTVTFLPGQSTVWLEVFPIADGVSEGAETVVLQVELGSAYSRGLVRSASVRIHDGPLEAWMDERWPGQPPASWREPRADPDSDGIPNVLEYLLGRDPVVSGSHQVPEFRRGDGMVEFRLPRSRVDSGWALRLESSWDLVRWQAVLPISEEVTPGPVVDDVRWKVAAPGASAFYRWIVVPPRGGPGEGRD